MIFTYEELAKAEERETVTAEGLAWLAGWRAAERHTGYVDAYGGDRQDRSENPPGTVGADHVGAWHDGWGQYLADHDGEES